MSAEDLPQTQPYPRLRAPVYFSKLAFRLFRRRRRPTNDAPNGIRVYMDESLPQPGDRLRIEVFLPDGNSIVCKVEVSWIQPVPSGAPALYEVGLRLTAIDPLDRERLSTVLENA